MERGNLKRTFTLGTLFIYGLGDILGAGIYALIGKVAAEAGYFSWVSFSMALVIALLTALSYGELTRRHPHSGGVSYFVQKATDRKSFAFLVGWLLLCVSTVSMATLTRAFIGYAQGFGFEVPAILLIIFFLGLLTLINIWGIEQSSKTNIVSTVIEVLGLVVVAIAGIYFLLKGEAPTSSRTDSTFSPLGIVQGAALAFYAFIGFEDLANVAEEVKQPRKHLPIAIVSSLLVAGIFYVFIGWISTQVVSPQALAKSAKPLTEIVIKSQMNFPVSLFGVVAIFAVANTCLLNYITGSRLLYGMSIQRIIPSRWGKIHPRFKTPVIAILSILPFSLLLAVLGDLKFLAGTTSVLILLVFSATNLSLIRIKKKEHRGQGFTVPVFVPWLALITNLLLISFSDGNSILMAFGFILLGGSVLWVLKKTTKNAKSH